jgi:hypothetical protein
LVFEHDLVGTDEHRIREARRSNLVELGLGSSSTSRGVAFWLAARTQIPALKPLPLGATQLGVPSITASSVPVGLHAIAPMLYVMHSAVATAPCGSTVDQRH